jgi:DHA3 family macrolide efflux protein-like MFS transporter
LLFTNISIVGFMSFEVGIALLGMPLGYAISGLVGESLNVQLTYIHIGVVLVLICIPPLFNKEYRSI